MSLSWRTVFLLVPFALSVAGADTAQAYDYQSAQVSVWVPTGWKSQSQGQVFMFTDQQEQVPFMLLPLPVTTPGAALPPANVLRQVLGTILQNVTFSATRKQTKLNGMDAILVEGTGQIQGAKAEWAASVILTPNNKVVALVGFVEAARSKQFASLMVKILTSVQPLSTVMRQPPRMPAGKDCKPIEADIRKYPTKEVDLDGDGTKELIIEAESGSDYCGTAGCFLWVYRRCGGGKYLELLDENQVGYTILGSRTKGFRDLKLTLREDAQSGAEEHHYRFNGRKYQRSAPQK